MNDAAASGEIVHHQSGYHASASESARTCELLVLHDIVEYIAESHSMKLTCEHCLHFDVDPASIEAQLPGIKALGSAYSSTMGRAGICRVTDQLLDPIPAGDCRHFERRTR